MLAHTVGNIIDSKKLQELVSAPPSATAHEAAALMSGKGVGAVVIRDAGGRVEGIFTERDVMRRIVAEGRDAKATRVSSVMSPNVRHVPSSTTVEAALQLMVMHGYRHLLVMDDGSVRGLISIRDLMQWFIMPETAMAPEGRYGHILSRTQEAVRSMQGMKAGNDPKA
jgi:CBS domain-containing protein